LAALLALAAWSPGAEFRNEEGKGCVVSVFGTSTLHDWTVRGRTVSGALSLARTGRFDPNALTAGEVPAVMTLSIPAKSLVSIKADGKPYSVKMDREMYSKLKADEHPAITYTLTRLAFREKGPGDAPILRFDAEGEVTAAGATKAITMPIEVAFPNKNRVKVSGRVRMKMTDFKITPPRNLLVLGTGDDVLVTFEWTGERVK
jgi:hypothetical protein